MLSNKIIYQSCRVLSTLSSRGLLYQHTAPEIPVQGSAYCGFDPTAQSLHLGNLISILNLVRLQQLGFKPIGIVGGATVQLGDPSMRAQERSPITREVQNANA